jgi:predicted porin
MNKKIIGTSVALLFAATGAFAQTSVTMYGTVDAGLFYNHGTYNGIASPPAGSTLSGGKVIGLASGQQSYSRIGFRGVEDLGSGLKALFVLEQGVDLSTGNSGYSTIGSQIPTTDFISGNTVNSGTFSSQAFVGLSSNVAGTVTYGRQFSPLYEAYGQIDPFQNGFAANINNFFGTIGNNSFYQRMDNAVIYHTPENLWGFNGALAYGFGEVAGSTAQEAQYGLNVGYSNGPLTITYAFHHANNDFNAFPVFKTHFIGATWDFNVVKLHGAFDYNKLNDNSFKTQDYMIGVTVPFAGVHTLFGDWTHKKDKVTDDANSNQFAIGYTYAMSKRTNLYASYAYIRNNTNAFVFTDTPGTSVNTFQIGMRHMF